MAAVRQFKACVFIIDSLSFRKPSLVDPDRGTISGHEPTPYRASTTSAIEVRV